MSGKVLVIETLRGLQRSGPAQYAYLYCLGFQSLVLLLWWPASTALTAERTPAVFFAVLLATGFSLCYHSLRTGAEELLLPGQQSLREWLLSSRIATAQLLSGYFAAHLIQTIYWLLLSLPVLTIAWSVGGSHWKVLLLSLLLMLLLASVLRVAAAVIYLLAGHHRELCWYSLRLLLLLVFVGGTLLSPLSSYWHLTDNLLRASYSGERSPLLAGFVLIYGSCLVLLWLLLTVLARRLRGAASG